MHQDSRTLTQEWKDCIAACFRCAQTCEECSDDMIGMGGARVKYHWKCH